MSSNNSSSGIGLPTLVFIVFLVLKLIGVISWSWWWVTAPLWIPALGFGAILLAIALVFLVSKDERKSFW